MEKHIKARPRPGASPAQLARAVAGVVSLALAIAGPAAAAAERVKVAVLQVGLQEVAADQGQRYLAVVEDELSAIGLFEVVTAAQRAASSPARPEASPAALSACLEKRSCVQRLGHAWHTAVVIHLSAAKSLGGIRFTMRSFDTATGSLLRKQAEFAATGDEEVERTVRWMTRSVISPVITALAKGKATLQIACQVPDAKLFINDRPFGTVANKRFKVSSGVFDLVVSRDGYLPFHDRVVLLAGQDKTFTVELKPDPDKVAHAEPVAPPPVKKPEPEGPLDQAKPGFLPGEPPAVPKPGEPGPEPATPVWKAWWFWTVIGVAVAGAAGTTAYFLLSDQGPSGQGGFEVTWQ